MSEPIEIREYPDPMTGSTTLAAKFYSTVCENLVDGIAREIVRLVAARYVSEHFAELAAKLDQNAIANLAIAEAAKKIAEEIRLKPSVIHEVETEVWQRGIFGGMRRVR